MTPCGGTNPRAVRGSDCGRIADCEKSGIPAGLFRKNATRPRCGGAT
jgi:hypothetical protein